MNNDKNRQTPTTRPYGGPQRVLGGRSCPTMANTRGGIPTIDERQGKRLCDGSIPGDGNDTNNSGCGKDVGDWGLSSYHLAMVYSPLQEFHQLYEPDVALNRGTLFAELDLPFEGGKKGGLCL